MKRNKVDIITLGCSKNLVDSEQLLRQFTANGYEIAHDPASINGEIVVVNTCGFIGDAQEESINMILELGEAKRSGKIGQLYVMGCLSQRFLKEMRQELPEVDRFYGKFNWKELITDLNKTYKEELKTDRILTTPNHYAYLKIAEGCDRTCSYCSIPLITGRYQSSPIEELKKEAELLVSKGVKELQLIAQDLTYYGLDIYKRMALPELVESLSDIEGVEWIRLHYGYPNHFPLDLLHVMRERENVCKYMDIALQHISNPVLKRMRRNITGQETCELLAKIREEVPGIHLRTTVMVGFPDETDQEFDELVDFVKTIRFERLGGFTYSHEAATYSYEHYTDNIPQEVKQERLDYIMRIQESIAAEHNEEKIGKVFKVMIDKEEGDYYIGRTEFDSPDVDPEILIRKNQKLKSGHFYHVKVTEAQPFELYGDVLP